MAHNTTIKGLKSLTKINPLTVAPEELTKHINGESDRSTIILMGSVLDDILGELLKHRFQPNLSAESLSSMFEFNGILGTFSSRIDISVAIGLMPKELHWKLNTIRIMRNTAAHSIASITFDTPEIRSAVVTLADSKYHRIIETWDCTAIKQLLVVMTCHLIAVASDIKAATGDQERTFIQAVSRAMDERQKASA